MKITSYIWQGLITLTLIFTSLWIYDRYFNQPALVQIPQANFNRVSLAEKRINRLTGLTDFRKAAAISKSSVVYITSFEKVFPRNEIVWQEKVIKRAKIITDCPAIASGYLSVLLGKIPSLLLVVS